MEIHRVSSRACSLFSVSSALHHHALGLHRCNDCCVATYSHGSSERLLCEDTRLHFVATQWLVPTTGFRASSRLRLNGPLEQKGQLWPTSHIKVINVHGCQRISRDFRYIVTHLFSIVSAICASQLSKHARRILLNLARAKEEEKRNREENGKNKIATTRGERKIENHFRQPRRSPRNEYVERTIRVSMKNSIRGCHLFLKENAVLLPLVRRTFRNLICSPIAVVVAFTMPRERVQIFISIPDRSMSFTERCKSLASSEPSIIN